MKKTFKNLAVTLAAALVALALFGCGDSEKPVSYDGTYLCPVDEQYMFLSISGDKMTMYCGDTEDFSKAVPLVDGTYKLTVRNEEGITAQNTGSLVNLITVYKSGTKDGAPTLVNEEKNRTFVKI